MITTLISQLKDLHSRDRAELKKIHNYQKRAESEPDEEFKQHALKLLQHVTNVNATTKDNIKIFKGKIKAAVDDMVKTHNASIMDKDSRKRKASLEAEPDVEHPTAAKPNASKASDPSPKKWTTKKRKVTLVSAADMDTSDEQPKETLEAVPTPTPKPKPSQPKPKSSAPPTKTPTPPPTRTTPKQTPQHRVPTPTPTPASIPSPIPPRDSTPIRAPTPKPQRIPTPPIAPAPPPH